MSNIRPNLTKTQWALLGRMADHDVVINTSWHRPSGWETNDEDTSRWSSYGSRSVATTMITALNKKDFITSNDERWRVTNEGRSAWNEYSAKNVDRRSMTKKPCHGCQEGGSRELDRLCSKCQKQFVAGLQILDLENAEPADTVLVSVTSPNFPYRTYHSHDGPAERVGELLLALVKFTMPKRPNTDRYTYPKDAQPLWGEDLRRHATGSEHATYHDSDPEPALLLRQFHVEICAALEEAYRCGHRDGNGLLRGLADGSMTVDDYNDKLAETP